MSHLVASFLIFLGTAAALALGGSRARRARCGACPARELEACGAPPRAGPGPARTHREVS